MPSFAIIAASNTLVIMPPVVSCAATVISTVDKETKTGVALWNKGDIISFSSILCSKQKLMAVTFIYKTSVFVQIFKFLKAFNYGHLNHISLTHALYKNPWEHQMAKPNFYAKLVSSIRCMFGVIALLSGSCVYSLLSHHTTTKVFNNPAFWRKQSFISQSGEICIVQKAWRGILFPNNSFSPITLQPMIMPNKQCHTAVESKRTECQFKLLEIVHNSNNFA